MNKKPAFDPNKKYEPVEVKPEFDPNAPFEEVNASQRRALSGDPSVLKALALGAAQGVSAGYVPQAVGGLAKIRGEDYTAARDLANQMISREREESPIAYNVGVMGGAAIPFLAGPLGAASKIPAISRLPGLAKVLGYGAAQGLVQNPGDVEGIVDPIQPGERLKNAAIGAATEGVAAPLSNFIGASARASRMQSAMQKPGFEQSIQGKIRDAASQLQKNYIAPRSEQIGEMLQGKTVDFRPDILRNLNVVNEAGKKTKGMEKLADVLERKASKDWATSYDPSTESFVVNPLKVEWPAEKANKLRQILDRRSDFLGKNALGSPDVAASSSKINAAANVLRRKVKEVAPESSPLFAEQAYGLGLKGELLDKAKAPQSLLTSQPLGDMGSKIVDVDSLAGTNLKGLSDDLIRAKMLANTQEPGFMGGVSGITKKLALSPLAYASRAPEKVLNRGLSEAELRLIIESMARNQSPYREENQ